MDQNHIRNFCIIAHIDHGKSTLADRLLEITHTISPDKMHSQYLDSMDLEREKGITIKLKAVRMHWKDEKGQEYIFNLIDTPGHVDFSYEVSRSLAACEGAILLVDATQGIQAQTLANFYNALNQNLEIIPVINKIDMINADVEGVKKDLCQNLGFNEDEIILVSAKDGTGVDKIFPEIIEKVPQPQGKITNPFRALIFDSIYDQHKGVILYIRIVDGEINKTNRVKMMVTKAETEILELGYLSPTYHVADSLHAGEVGFIATGLKNLSLCHVGDTVIKSQNSVSLIPLPGYRKVKPMVFLGLYPTDSGEFLRLKEALLKIQLTDASLEFSPESSPALGNGFRCGFLGLLHAEIVKERLEREYDLDLLATVPNVE
ncbi:elongation factor 4, partial [candidate division CPR3 bacterium RIFOXYC2_FULL_35_7]